MGILSFFGNLFGLLKAWLYALIGQRIFEAGVLQGQEQAREADRQQAIKEADAITGLAQQVRERERQAVDEKARIDATDPLDGRVRGDQSSAWILEGDVADPDDSGAGR